MTVTVRFAPSPTGNIHIGNARTALINWIYARQNGGSFILRYDDTDRVRSKQEYADGIARDLAWLGIEPDRVERQSERAAAHEAATQKLKDAGESVHERLVEFPLWEEYEEELKSTIADVKNLGSPLAGATTAGKFLERFTAYPWIHVDISGMTFFDQPFEYLPAGGTGAGTRLIIEFLKNLS